LKEIYTLGCINYSTQFLNKGVKPMNKLILTSVFALTLLGVSSVTTQEAYAFGGRGQGRGPSPEHHEEMLTKKAEFLGVTVEEVKEAWENRTFHELLTEKGYTFQDMWNQMKETMREHMSERGLTDDEIDSRFERKEEHMQRRQEWLENNPDSEPPFRGHWGQK